MSDYIGTCRAGHTVRGTSDHVNAGGGWLTCGCGRQAAAKALRARHSARLCNAICTHANGPACSCECGGRNHGAGNIYQPPTKGTES